METPACLAISDTPTLLFVGMMTPLPGNADNCWNIAFFSLLYAKVTEILNLNFNESFEIDLKYSK